MRKCLKLISALLVVTMLLTACGLLGEAEEEERYASLNEWHTVGDWEINVSHTETMDTFDIPGSQYYFVPREGFRFFIVHLSVRNNGAKEDRFVPTVPAFGTLRASMDIGEERQWMPSNMVLYVGGIARSRHDILNTIVEAGEMIEGIIGFEIRPEILADSENVLNLLFADNENRLLFNLRDIQ